MLQYIYVPLLTKSFFVSVFFFYSNKASGTVPLYTWKKKHRIEISMLLGEMKLHKILNKIWRKKGNPQAILIINIKPFVHGLFCCVCLLIVILSLYIYVCLDIYFSFLLYLYIRYSSFCYYIWPLTFWSRKYVYLW